MNEMNNSNYNFLVDAKLGLLLRDFVIISIPEKYVTLRGSYIIILL
jgi:hypothetical protein